MLILDLGIWILPFTLLIAPCRRLTHLIARLRKLLEGVGVVGSPWDAIAALWRRLAGAHIVII